MGFFSDRRNRIVESYLTRMAKKGSTDVSAPDLYFDAACRYAQDNGGKLYPDMRDSIIFDKEIDGKNYSVFFLVGRGGRGTNITLTEKCNALSNLDDIVNSGRSALSELDDIVNKWATKTDSTKQTNYPTWAEAKDMDKIQALSDGVISAAHTRGLPITYIEETLTQNELMKGMLVLAAELEKGGSTFAQQQDGAAKLLVMTWNKLSDSEQKVLSDLG